MVTLPLAAIQLAKEDKNPWLQHIEELLASKQKKVCEDLTESLVIQTKLFQMQRMFTKNQHTRLDITLK